MTELHQRLQRALAGRYAPLRELGRGGMAVVYLAEDVKHHRKVALKILRPEVAAVLGAERFLREIETAARLSHPHILPLYDSGEADGLLYYVMPYIEGESLRQRLNREKQLPLDDAVQIAREAADALAYAHSNGVVHRDIKPENILLAAGHAAVADFGIARAIDAAGGERLTETGVTIGTPAYMSPEQAAGDRQVDGRSDVYSLGCVLYEMLAGTPPFTGPTVESVVRQHLTAEPPTVTAVRRTVPRPVAQALERALAKTPADRFTTAQQFAEALARVRPEDAEPGRAHEPPREATGAIGTDPAPPLRVALLFGVASLVVLAAVYGIMLLAGLPGWVFLGAVILLVIGLPIMVVTAHHERRRARGRARGGVPTPPGAARRLFTWRYAVLGGVVAFAGLGLGTAAYMAMRALGIGPVGTLLATGVLERRDQIILADFTQPASETTLAAAVSEAFRVDLAQSPVVNLLDRAELASALERMERDPGSPIDLAVARELAAREGIKAIVTGEINAVGGGYVLSTRLINGATGNVIQALREEGRDSTEIIPAINRLSRRLRERIGESLKSIRAGRPLDQVTTASLPALRLYSEGARAVDYGDPLRGMELLREAIALDTAFAMAYRKLAIVLTNTGRNRTEAVEVLEKAFAHRNRLPAVERHLVVAAYYGEIGEPQNAAAAYRAALEIDPGNRIALNNLAGTYALLQQHERQLEVARQYVEHHPDRGAAYGVLAGAHRMTGNLDSAEAALAAAVARDSGRAELAWGSQLDLDLARGDAAAAERRLDSLAGALQQGGPALGVTLYTLAHLNAMRGHLAEAERNLRRFREGTEVFADLPHWYLVATAELAEIQFALRNDADAAVREVQAALERHPLDSIPRLDRPYVQLARFYARAGRANRARALLDAYERVVPARYRGAGFRFGTAREGYDYVRGLIGLASAEPTEATAAFLQGQRGWCHRCGLAGLGDVHERLGQTDSAIAYYERFLEPVTGVERIFSDRWLTFPAVLRRLGELYQQRGERQKAIEYYTSFVTLWEDADPELQPQVVEVKRRMARLVGEQP